MGNETSSKILLIPENDQIPKKKRNSFSRALEHLKEKDKAFDISPEEYKRIKDVYNRASSHIICPPFCFVR
ncbi:hypothetical protein I4U23_005801 [Adineta vaga]|nr:hypothetical protein I4U23_005801 [Adineta vaga]